MLPAAGLLSRKVKTATVKLQTSAGWGASPGQTRADEALQQHNCQERHGSFQAQTWVTTSALCSASIRTTCSTLKPRVKTLSFISSLRTNSRKICYKPKEDELLFSKGELKESLL